MNQGSVNMKLRKEKTETKTKTKSYRLRSAPMIDRIQAADVKWR